MLFLHCMKPGYLRRQFMFLGDETILYPLTLSMLPFIWILSIARSTWLHRIWWSKLYPKSFSLKGTSFIRRSWPWPHCPCSVFFFLWCFCIGLDLGWISLYLSSGHIKMWWRRFLALHPSELCKSQQYSACSISDGDLYILHKCCFKSTVCYERVSFVNIWNVWNQRKQSVEEKFY